MFFLNHIIQSPVIIFPFSRQSMSSISSKNNCQYFFRWWNCYLLRCMFIRKNLLFWLFYFFWYIVNSCYKKTQKIL